MVVITLTDVPPAVRGDLTKWLFEINVGVYVGQISARVRDELWTRIVENAKVGRITMVYQTNNEQHFAYRVHNSTWKPIDFDGLTLMMRPNLETHDVSRLRPGFSIAAHRRIARRIQMAESKKAQTDQINKDTIDDNCSDAVKVTHATCCSDNIALEEHSDSELMPSSTDSDVKDDEGGRNDSLLLRMPLKSATETISLDNLMLSDGSNIHGISKNKKKIVKNDRCSHDCVIVSDANNVNCHAHRTGHVIVHSLSKNACDGRDIPHESESKSEIDRINGIQSIHSYVVIDLETTGLDEKEHEIIEFGALRVRDGQIVSKFQRFVLIQNDIPPFIEKLTGITDDMIDALGVELETALSEFLSFIGNDLLVGHNIAFDMKFINAALERVGKTRISNCIKCTYEMSKVLLPSAASRKLKSIAEFYGIAGGGAHRSLEDCECVYRVYECMLRQLSRRRQ